MRGLIISFERAVLELEDESQSFAQFVFALHVLLENLVGLGKIEWFGFEASSARFVVITADFAGSEVRDIEPFSRTFYYKPEDK